MRVYIASKYIEHKDINRMIYSRLIKNNIDAFLPETINIDAESKEEMYIVANRCYDEIDKCDTIIIVAPFGQSVAAEIGYAVSKIRNYNKKRLVMYNYNDDSFCRTKKESMIYPFVEKEFNELDTMIDYLLSLKTI